jgi:hypothetical protein
MLTRTPRGKSLLLERQRGLRNQRQRRRRARRALDLREAPQLYNADLLDFWVEHRVISEAVASSGDDRLIGQTVSIWWLKRARAWKGRKDLDWLTMGLW